MDCIRIDTEESPECSPFEPLDVLDVSSDGVRGRRADEILDFASRTSRSKDAAVFERLVVDSVSGGGPALLLASGSSRAVVPD